MSQRNVIEEVEARIKYVPRWKLILGVVLLILPISILGMVFFGYELYRAGKRLEEDKAGIQNSTESELA